MSSRIFALLSVVVVASLQNCRLTPPFRQLEFSFPLVLLPDPAPVEPPYSAAVASSSRARRSSRQESPPSGIAVCSGIFMQRFVARSLPPEAAQLRCRLASMPDQREYPDQTHYRPDPRSSSASLLFTSQASLLPRKGPVTPMWY